MAAVAIVMLALVAAGWVGRGLLDAPEPAGDAPVGRPDASPRLAGTDDEPVKAVARALGGSVVVVRTGSGLGSGVIYDGAGLILTNAHVVGDAATVTVTLDDGRSVPGTVAGADEASDIAVVRVAPPRPLTPARLAVAPPEVGDLVVALGSPFGLDQTITSGIVSAVDRPVGNGAGGVDNMVQTDAAINPGNSGGALANRRAEVIGINSMIYSRSGTSSGIGFAIPIARARSVADRLVAGRPVERARLGVRARPAAEGVAGAELVEVEPGGPAAAAGLVVGDVITGVAGHVVKDPTGLAGAVAARQPGDVVTVDRHRDGQPGAVAVTLGAVPAAPVDPAARGPLPRSG